MSSGCKVCPSTVTSSPQDFTLSVHSSPLFFIFLYSKLDNRVYKNTENAPLSTHFYNDLTGLTAKSRKKKSSTRPVFPREVCIADGHTLPPYTSIPPHLVQTLALHCLHDKGASNTLSPRLKKVDLTPKMNRCVCGRWFLHRCVCGRTPEPKKNWT